MIKNKNNREKILSLVRRMGSIKSYDLNRAYDKARGSINVGEIDLEAEYRIDDIKNNISKIQRVIRNLKREVN